MPPGLLERERLMKEERERVVAGNKAKIAAARAAKEGQQQQQQQGHQKGLQGQGQVQVPKRKNTARKSTAGSTAKVVSSDKRNVARKSTAAGPVVAVAMEEYSFYGADVDAVDMSQISTRIKMGGMEITLNAKQVVEMMKLDPRVRVRDCHKSKQK